LDDLRDAIDPEMSVNLTEGYLVLGRQRGIPLRLHWTIPIGAVLLTGFTMAPSAWLAFPFVVLIHELGHAGVARLVKLRVVSVNVHGLGGSCECAGVAGPAQLTAVAWGGVLAQSAAMLLASALAPRLGLRPDSFADQFLRAFILANFVTVILNLVPARPLDGEWAWRLGWLGRGTRDRYRRWRSSRLRRRRERVSHQVVSLDEHRKRKQDFLH
jgi:Zn-dependent protease